MPSREAADKHSGAARRGCSTSRHIRKEVMPIASWLFIRGSESIWIERPFGTTLIVAGPAHCRQQRTFISESELQRFQIALAEDLSAKGWFLWAYNSDRRQKDRGDAIRTGDDRRLAPRSVDTLVNRAGS